MKLNLGFLRAPTSKRTFFCLLIGLVVVMVTVSVLFSAMPWAVTFLELGRAFATIPFLKWLVGPIPILEYCVLIVFMLSTLLVSLFVSEKISRRGLVRGFILTLVMYMLLSSLVSFSFSLVFMPQVLQAGTKIDTFVSENGKMSFRDYIASVEAFLNNNLNPSYNKPEASLMINRIIDSTIADPHTMKFWGVTEADLIVYQGWGSCGEAAKLTEELLHGAGYETRRAHFKNIDHEWAEVRHNGTWWIIDPWYIGRLVDVGSLKNVKPAFQNASGVEVQYRNGTVVDVSLEHGY